MKRKFGNGILIVGILLGILSFYFGYLCLSTKAPSNAGLGSIVVPIFGFGLLVLGVIFIFGSLILKIITTFKTTKKSNEMEYLNNDFQVPKEQATHRNKSGFYMRMFVSIFLIIVGVWNTLSGIWNALFEQTSFLGGSMNFRDKLGNFHIEYLIEYLKDLIVILMRTLLPFLSGLYIFYKTSRDTE